MEGLPSSATELPVCPWGKSRGCGTPGQEEGNSKLQIGAWRGVERCPGAGKQQKGRSASSSVSGQLIGWVRK